MSALLYPSTPYPGLQPNSSVPGTKPSSHSRRQSYTRFFCLGLGNHSLADCKSGKGCIKKLTNLFATTTT